MTSESRRLVRMTALIVLALVVVAGRSLQVGVFGADAITRSDYHDETLLGVAENLALAGAFAVGDDGVGVVANQALIAETSKATNYRVRTLQALAESVTEEGGVIRVDRSAVRQVNPRRALDRGRVPRGRILDRHGLLLAGADRTTPGDTSGVRRIYPMGAAGFAVIGIAHPAYGRTGLEDALDGWLSGSEHGTVAGFVYDRVTHVDRGPDVVLTLDGRLQRAAYELLAGRRGAIVLLEVPSFEVLVATSSPSFDPATPGGPQWLRAQRDRLSRPFADRALAETFYPGSTFKVAMAAAWLEARGRDGFRTDCHGGRHPRFLKIREHGGEAHGSGVDVSRGLTVSCNHLFGELAGALGAEATPVLDGLGFNRAWDLGSAASGTRIWTARSEAFAAPVRARGTGEVGAPAAGSPPTDPWEELAARAGGLDPADSTLTLGATTVDPTRREFADAAWFAGNPGVVAQGGIGQNVVKATPLEMAVVAGVVASGGSLVPPRLLASIRRPGPTGSQASGRTYLEVERPRPHRVLSEVAARSLASMMERVMTEGTGARALRAARLPGLRIAGKTGTAEVGDFPEGSTVAPDRREPHSWFIGFAPADAPRYAVAVLVENAGFGSAVAAPIGIDLLARAERASGGVP